MPNLKTIWFSCGYDREDKLFCPLCCVVEVWRNAMRGNESVNSVLAGTMHHIKIWVVLWKAHNIGRFFFFIYASVYYLTFSQNWPLYLHNLSAVLFSDIFGMENGMKIYIEFQIILHVFPGKYPIQATAGHRRSSSSAPIKVLSEYTCYSLVLC